MKRIPVLLIASIFIFFLSACGKDTARTIAVEEINGTTHVTNQLGTMDVYVGQHLISGDDVKVETDSNMTLLIDMDKHLFADAGTHFSLEATGSKGNTQTKINLFEGSVLSGIDNKLKDSETYEVSTPNATMAVRGTVFQVICEKISDGNFITTVKVSEGSVEATTIENGETIVKTISAGNEGEFTGTASKIVKDVSESVPDEDIADSIDGGILTLHREADAEWFSPLTDDYLYVIDSVSTGGVDGDQEYATLYSFDENGYIIQHMERSINSFIEEAYNPEDSGFSAEEDGVYIYNEADTVYADIFSRYVDGGTHYTPQWMTEKADFIYKFMGKGLTIYASKPNENLQRVFSENDESLADCEIVKLGLNKTDDYRVIEEDYGGYFKQSMICYDEQGNFVQNWYIYVYNSAEEANAAYEDIRIWYAEYISYIRLQDNLVIFSMDPDDPYNSLPNMKQSGIQNYGKQYFSKPYLTEIQWKYMIDEYY